MNTLLVVDDEKSVRYSFKSMFGDEYRILTAGDGIEALDIFERESGNIDVIFLDVRMRRVCAEQGPRFLLIEPAVACRVDQTPIIGAHGEIEQQAVGAGEVEIDDARDAPVFEQRVVAKQVRVHRPAWQVRKPV